MLAPLLAALLLPGLAQEPKPVPSDLAREVERAERIGRALFESDQAAWHGSDALAASKGPLEKLGLGGFLARRERDAGWTVLFLSAEDPPRILQRVAVEASQPRPKVLDTPAPLPLSSEDAPLWAARQLAIESGGPYEQTINPVVLRGSDFGEHGILVYLLGGSEKPDVAVLGRHVRVRLSDDGARVTEVLPLVKGVIESPTKSSEGKRVVALMAAQVVTDFPTEVQVFAQLNANLPLFVTTRRGLWKLEQGRIAYLGEKPPANPTPKAALQLALRERAGGAPREGSVHLWRIGVPAEPGWSAGDVYVGPFRVPAAGLAIPGLEPGKYRAICDVHAGRAGDLPAFDVRAGSSDVVLEIDPPRERESWVEIFDARGQVFEKAEYKRGSRSGSLKAPAWISLRRPIEEDGTEFSGNPGGYTSSSSAHTGWQKLVRGAHGFALGPEAEDNQVYETTRAITLRVPDHGTVGGSVRFDSADEQRYRVLLVEKGSFEGLFTLPDGGELDLERLHVQTPLEPDVEPRPPEWWLDVPVRVAIQAPGCKRLELEFRLRGGLPRPQRLEKAP